MTQNRSPAILRLACIAATTACLAAIAQPVMAQSILGNWRTKTGAMANVSGCGANFCITLRSGKHKGKRIGQMARNGASYAGSITDPDTGKIYSGTASVTVRTMALSGCVLRLFCRSETWTRR